MTYDCLVLALTRHFAKLSISPESSDGFASVGTILPKEEAALLPGGLFAFCGGLLKWVAERGKDDPGGQTPCVEADREGVGRACWALAAEVLAMVGVLVIIGFVVLLVAPCLVAASVDLDEEDAN